MADAALVGCDTVTHALFTLDVFITIKDDSGFDLGH